MESINYFFLLRLFAGLILGFWIARNMRGILRALVIRAMPVKKRISDDSFRIQTRYTTFVAIAFAFTIAGLVYWGTGRLIRGPELPGWKKAETVRLAAPVPEAFPLPLEETTPLPETLPVPAEVLPSSKPVPATGEPIYLQLYAFRSEERARAQQSWWAGRLSRTVWIGHSPDDPVPYKVLIGPFSSREEALQFRMQHQLEGFPRKPKQLILYAR